MTKSFDLGSGNRYTAIIRCAAVFVQVQRTGIGVLFPRRRQNSCKNPWRSLYYIFVFCALLTTKRTVVIL
jgi:hypothetical protein